MMRSYHSGGFGALQSYQLAAITVSHSHWNQPCHIRPISCPKAVTAVLAVPTGINDRSCTIVLAPIRTHSPSFFSPSSSLWKLTFIFGRRVASSDWSNWSKWAASPWCTVSGEMDGRKWSEWCGATASGKKAVKLDAIGPKPCPWWPSAKQVECPSWLCWPVRSETKLLIADFKAMLLSNKAFYRQTKLLFFPTDTDPKQPRTHKIAELIHTPMFSDPGQFSASQISKAESHLHISLEILLESASSGLHGMQHHKLDQTLLIDIRLFSEIHVRTSIRVTSPLISIVACNSRRIVIAVLSVLRLCLIWRLQMPRPIFHVFPS